MYIVHVMYVIYMAGDLLWYFILIERLEELFIHLHVSYIKNKTDFDGDLNWYNCI